jgi:hypothetical protein
MPFHTNELHLRLSNSIRLAIELGIVNDQLNQNYMLSDLFVLRGSLIISEEYELVGNVPNTEEDFGIFVKPFEESTNFILLGDWGKGGLNGDITGKSEYVSDGNDNSNKKVAYTYQAAIGRAINDYVTDTGINNFSAVITLGDNFYDNGVASSTDSSWMHLWKNVYNGPAMELPWFGVLGNHDYGYSTSGVQVRISLIYVFSNILEVIVYVSRRKSTDVKKYQITGK